MMPKLVLILCAASLSWAGQNVVTQQAEILRAPRPASSVTPLLFEFVTSQAGFDTEITISNTSQDTLGSVPQSGSCTLTFYGSGAPTPQTSSLIPAGKHVVFNLSQGGSGIEAAPNFQGYVTANCGFPRARGLAKMFALSANLAFSQDAQVLTIPRSTARPQYLLFPFVTNEAGYDTGIAVANTSQDPFGTTPTSGSCALNFYGSNAPPAFATPQIPAGSVYVNLASMLAPSFQGYVIASCNFYAAASTAL